MVVYIYMGQIGIMINEYNAEIKPNTVTSNS
jgi:hypothetical protein